MSSVVMDHQAPRCLVLMLQLSASMSTDIPTDQRDCPKFLAACLLADRMIEDQIATLASESPSPPAAMDISIVGYRTTEDSSTVLVSLLPDENARPHFVKLTELAAIQVPARNMPDWPRKWCSHVKLEGEGDPDPITAFAGVHWLVQRWIAEQPNAGASLIVHCCDGTGITAPYELLVKSLSVLNGGIPAPALFHYVVTENYSGRMTPNLYAGRLPENLQRLWETSSVLAAYPPNCLKHVPRAMTINEWPGREIAQLVESTTHPAIEIVPEPLEMIPEPAAVEEAADLSHVADTVIEGDALLPESQAEAAVADEFPTTIEDSSAPAPVPIFAHVALALHKRGNEKIEWEDAFHLDPLLGAVAVSDGASEGIFCRHWSALLAKLWVNESPDLSDAKAYSAWLNRCRAGWMEAINYPKARPIQQMKVDNVGAAATFLGLRIERKGPKQYQWRAVAAGDSCLFWVRNQQLLATFPLTRGSQFKMPPLLLRTKRVPSPFLTRAGGDCEEGDLFLLATDAVANRLMNEHDQGPVDWARFETIEPAAWEEEIERLRNDDLIANDDCTLVVVRVGTAEHRTKDS